MIVALIPARSGSKRVKDKNIRPLGGYPLMAWSIACAKMCGLPTYVSSENTKYLGIVDDYGVTPVRREKGFNDEDGDLAYVEDFEMSVIPKAISGILLLRPTTPLREPSVLVKLMEVYKEITGHYITLCSARDTLDKHYIFNGDIILNLPPSKVFYRNTGYAELFPYGRFGWEPFAFTQEHEVGEIDTEEDFDYIEWRLQKYGSPIHDYLKTNYPNPE